MTDHVLLFPADDEAAWQRGTDADHQVTFDTDAEFARLLRASGGAITGGAALGPGGETQTLRRGPDGPLVTDGRYAESVEQISGFFLVTWDDHDALVEAAQVLTRAHPVVEIRPVADDCGAAGYQLVGFAGANSQVSKNAERSGPDCSSKTAMKSSVVPVESS